MKIILLILFFSLNVSAYTKKDISLAGHEFNRYIRPQLNSITQDYYTLLMLLNPEFKNLKTTYYKYKQIHSLAMQITTKCSVKKNIDCISELQKIIKGLSSILKLHIKPINIVLKKHINGQEILTAYTNEQKYKDHLFQTIFTIKDYLFFYQANIQQVYKIESIKSMIIENRNIFNLSVLQATDSRFRSKFTSYWNDFIKPVNNMILPKNDQEYFLRKLNEFNLRWNELNIQLTKRNKPIPKQVKTLLNIMHNRWNRILKVTLR
jgi:hypothetical protein